MRSFELFVAPDPQEPLPSGRRERARAAREVLDVFIGGANVTARVKGSQAACVLRDLGGAVVDLARRPHGKAIVRFYDDPWEMCVERFGGAAALSVYRAGTDPFVAVYDRVVPFREIVESTREAIEALAAPVPRAVAIELAAAVDALRAALPEECGEAPPPEPSPVSIEIDRDAPLSFGAEFALRSAASADDAEDTTVERADLHALLFRGCVFAEIRGRAVDVDGSFPFLFAERFLDITRRALDAWERGLPYHVRSEAGGAIVGVRVAASGEVALTMGASRAVHTFPALGASDVLEAALAFGRSLVRALLRRDRAQGKNLRLSAFRRQLREAEGALRELSQKDAKINPSPESYRAFASSPPPPSKSAEARLRYAVRWRALVPGIDLRSTFLCGDRMVIGAARETFCVDRASGHVLWRVPTERATSVVTPGGIARLSPDGTLRVHDFGDGEVTLRTKLAPRAGGPVSGAVVQGQGLPRMLIVTEGEHHLVALDLTSGDLRWRMSWGTKDGRAALRMKRAGKLLYFASGDSALTAIDVLTGAVVWRARDRLRFRSAPVFENDALFAVSGGVHCVAGVHCIDPFSGHVRWTAPVSEHGPCTVEGSPIAARSAIAVAVRERSQLRLAAFDRETGAPAWTSKAPVAPVGTSWLAVDDLLIGNTPGGEVVGIEAGTGELRYRRVLGPRALDSDVPRRLEPVLRCGALFIPHIDVHVLRPRDGAELATIAPCEAIPDLLRVDERCDVYVAEESGHLVSFGALPRLSLVR